MSSSAPTPSCQTCSSQLTPSALKGSFFPPCCQTPICPACLGRNPRLTEYVPCLRCGDLTTREGESSVIRGRRAREWKKADRDGGEIMFDADGDEVDELDPVDPEQGAKQDREPQLTNGSALQLPFQASETVKPSEEDLETIEVTHPVARSDTLLAIARRYAADPHELLDLNNLPPTALSSNPRILQTRKTIVISRRRVPRSHLSQVGDIDMTPDTPLDPEEAKRRAEERAVKRFQLVTKTVDPGVGKAYLAIQGEEAPHPLELGSGEVLDEASGLGKKGAMKGDLSQEDRAVEQWFEDDDWEQQRINGIEKKREGKWTRVGGSQWDRSGSKLAEGFKA